MLLGNIALFKKMKKNQKFSVTFAKVLCPLVAIEKHSPLLCLRAIYKDIRALPDKRCGLLPKTVSQLIFNKKNLKKVNFKY